MECARAGREGRRGPRLPLCPAGERRGRCRSPAPRQVWEPPGAAGPGCGPPRSFMSAGSRAAANARPERRPRGTRSCPGPGAATRPAAGDPRTPVPAAAPRAPRRRRRLLLLLHAAATPLSGQPRSRPAAAPCPSPPPLPLRAPGRRCPPPAALSQLLPAPRRPRLPAAPPPRTLR